MQELAVYDHALWKKIYNLDRSDYLEFGLMAPRSDVWVNQFGANSATWGLLYALPQMKIGGGGA